MKKKWFYLSALITLVLYACSPSASQPSLPPPTVVIDSSASTSVTETAPVPVAAEGTPVTTSDCTNSAGFVADVSVPDNTSFKQGTAFVKTWRIRNTGTCTWDENYALFFSNGSQMNSPASVSFQATAPGATVDLSVDLVAPSSDGTFTGNYELHDASGKPFSIDDGRYVWVKIVVGTAAAQPAGSIAGTGTGTSGSCTYTENSALVSQLFSLINSARASNGLSALSLNAKLSTSAMSHSIDMACHSSLSHTGSDGSSPKSRIADQGYTYTYADEAIYAQPPQYGGDAQAAFDWWLNDPPHRAIILNAKATEIGIGYAAVAESTLGGYFTADVGAP